MKRFTLLYIIGALAVSVAKAQLPPLSPEGKALVEKLMSQMTLKEKLGQLNLQVAGDITTGAAQDTNVGGAIARGEIGGVFNLKGVERIRALQEIAVKKSRLGIPLMVGMDVIHGYETIFPIPLALSCSWNPEAVEEVARISAQEASADGVSWTYSPMVDVALDARWGRVSEGNGEDPYLSGVMGAAMVRGYQGDDMAAADRVMSCVKHFAFYGAVESGRDYNTVDMSRVRMYNQFFPSYRAAVGACPGSVMTSFNLVDGIPATANPWLVRDVLRGQWGYDGLVVTDYGSIGEMLNHRVSETLREASLQALGATTDMDMCSFGYLGLGDEESLTAKEREWVDAACRRVLEAKWRLGLFADPFARCNPKRAKRELNTPEHRAAARRIAAETFVLLKNEHDLLPLRKDSRIALIGPLGDNRPNMDGTWVVAAVPERNQTLAEAMRLAVSGQGSVIYAQGCNLVADSALQVAAEFGKTIPRHDAQVMRDEALRVAREADVIVCAMGESADFSGECASRSDLGMPDVQHALLEELVALGKPVVLLHFAGRPTVLTWEEEHVDAVMNVWFGGTEMASAVCDVLFGDKSPCGHLTVSMPRSTGQCPLYYNHLSTGRPVPEGVKEFRKYQSNYLDVRNDPLYPFGYGLAYTTFSYTPVVLTDTLMAADGKVTASVTVTNTGKREGTAVVQLYVCDRVASIARPVKELKGFRRVPLEAGESRNVEFEITAQELQFFDSEGRVVLEPGAFDIMVGPHSAEVSRATLVLQ